MEQLFTIWRGLGGMRQAVVVGATVLVFAAVLTLGGVFSTAPMGLLYSGLEGARSGEVLQALEQRGVKYDVRGGSIFVQSDKRDELRMSLAAQGLPANGGAGYELLDSISGFGTTSQMFDAAYWRAKEGELARTITASDQIRSARVHLANPSTHAFRANSRPTASVSVTTSTGHLSDEQAKAIRYLIASAVSDMSPEDVSVIDGSGKLLIAGEANSADSHEREDAMRHSVERLLAARVGQGNAVVELSIDVVQQTESITERRLEPGSRVAISSELEERSDSSDSSGGANVTVASNLPEGAGAEGERSRTEQSETRERINYEVSETTRQIHKEAGDTRRLSVAVLVNGLKTRDASGQESWAERSADELADLKELVASAVGFDESRGDVITIRSLPFEEIEQVGTIVEPSESSISIDAMRLTQMLLLSVVSLALGLFVIKPVLMSRRTAAVLDDSTGAQTALEDQGVEELAPLAISTAPDFAPPDGGFPTMALGDFGAGSQDSDADPVARLKRLIDERREETVEVLRSWMDEKEAT